MTKAYLVLSGLLVVGALLWTSFSYQLQFNEVKTVNTSPNFIFILADDMGWDGTSVEMIENDASSNSDYYLTPELQNLADEGMTFSQAYAPAPKCSPSRNSILTGQTPARNKHTETSADGGGNSTGTLTNAPNTGRCIDFNDVTIAEWLQNEGYTTAHFGKWHLLANNCSTRTDEPDSHGFDSHDGDNGNPEGNTINANMTIATDPKNITDLTNKGIAFMNQAIAAGDPFYLQLSHYAVHAREESTQTSFDMFDTGQSTGHNSEPEYAGMTFDFDKSMKTIMDYVSNTMAISNNTYIIFMSDNGAPRGLSLSLSLRESKNFIYEGGVRVPMIVSGPNIPAGTYCSNAVVGYDLFKTIAELSGGMSSLPTDLDGQSIVPLLQQQSFTRSEPLYFHSPHYGNSGKEPSAAAVDENFKLFVRFDDCTPELYDLDTDLDESTDISGANAAKALELRVKLRDHLNEVDAEMPDLNSGSGTDKDNDDLPDSWEIENLLTYGCSRTDDPDGDGRDNGTEQAEETDPLVYTNVLDIKVLLQGAYNGTDMNDDLQTANVLETTDPYGLSESVASIPADIVDWLKIEFREPGNESNVLLEKAAFLGKDGFVCGLDGNRGLRLEKLEFTQANIVVQHRNHLGVMAVGVTTFQQ